MGSPIPNALIPASISFVLAIALYPAFIAILKRQSWRRDVREDVPASHQAKVGTPSMGGALFVAITLLIALANARGVGGELLILALTLLTFAIFGFVDDFAKAAGNRAGLRAREKMALQMAASALLGLWALTKIKGYVIIAVPFMHQEAGVGWSKFFLAALLLIGVSNAANVNDGMDGMCSGLAIIALSSFNMLGARAGRADVVLFCACLNGALMGFLYYNMNPARIFMGDTGSQALGAAVAMIAILLDKELWLAFICLPWLVDTLSVMIQVTYFKITKRLTGEGKRIFPITPIHHAFEKAGWSEWKVCALFWTVGAIAATVAVVWG